MIFPTKFTAHYQYRYRPRAATLANIQIYYDTSSKFTQFLTSLFHPFSGPTTRRLRPGLRLETCDCLSRRTLPASSPLSCSIQSCRRVEEPVSDLLFVFLQATFCSIPSGSTPHSVATDRTTHRSLIILHSC